MTKYLITVLSLFCVGAWAGEKPYFDGKQSLYSEAPVAEVMALPKFCWGKYIEKAKDKPQYNISKKQCGPYTNHYCQGLLRFNRSQSPMASKAEQRNYLKQAMGNFDYTLKGIKDYPACPIRRPGGALAPAMKETTGLLMPERM